MNDEFLSAVYLENARRYGYGYSKLCADCSILPDGSAVITRRSIVEAFSLLKSLDIYLQVLHVADLKGNKITKECLPEVKFVSNAAYEVNFDDKQVANDHMSVQLSFDPALDNGDKLEYVLEEYLPVGSFDLQNDFFGWNINRPTKEIFLTVNFPEGHGSNEFSLEVRHASTSGLPARRLYHEERYQERNLRKLKSNDGTSTVQLNTDLPQLGLMYIIVWRSPSK